MTYEERAIKLLEQVPDDFDYPTDTEFRKAINEWWIENVFPFLKEYYTSKETKDGSEE